MYKLFIEKSGSSIGRIMFDIPLPGICDEDDAIERAKILKSILKDGYVVEIVKTMPKSVGFVAN